MIVSGGDDGLVPDGVVAVAVIEYLEPGESPRSVHAGVEHATTEAEPPPAGEAVTVNRVAPDTGVSVTSAVVELVGVADMIAGTPRAGVLASAGADGGVALPPESVATTWTMNVVPEARPVREHVED